MSYYDEDDGIDANKDFIKGIKCYVANYPFPPKSFMLELLDEHPLLSCACNNYYDLYKEIYNNILDKELIITKGEFFNANGGISLMKNSYHILRYFTPFIMADLELSTYPLCIDLYWDGIGKWLSSNREPEFYIPEIIENYDTYFDMSCPNNEDNNFYNNYSDNQFVLEFIKENPYPLYEDINKIIEKNIVIWSNYGKYEHNICKRIYENILNQEVLKECGKNLGNLITMQVCYIVLGTYSSFTESKNGDIFRALKHISLLWDGINEWDCMINIVR